MTKSLPRPTTTALLALLLSLIILFPITIHGGDSSHVATSPPDAPLLQLPRSLAIPKPPTKNNQQKPWLPPYGGASQELVNISTITSKQEQEQQQQQLTKTTRNEDESSSISKHFHSFQSTTQQWKRQQIVILWILRLVFLLLTPISLALCAIVTAISIVITVAHGLTFGLAGQQVMNLAWAVSKATLAMTFASLTGILLPVFAMFGLLASLSMAALEMTEPILRIRYHRQLRKLKHLQKLLTDPVLMETMQTLLQGAQAVSSATQARLEATVTAARRHRRPQDFLPFRHTTMTTTSSSSSYELVESLLKSSGLVEKWMETFQDTAPQPLVQWTREQYHALRKSGVLEEAASRALAALQKDLEGAASFLPYLNALEQVRQDQQQLQHGNNKTNVKNASRKKT